MNGEQTSCRMCSSKNLEKYLDLGTHAPSDAFHVERDTIQRVFPLAVNLCMDCGLSQLSYTVPPEILYQQEYPYESSTTEGGKKHYFEFAKSVVDKFKLGKEDVVVDIGSNVGVLLEGFKNSGTRVLGIDPAQNIVKIANERGIETILGFFSREIAEKVRGQYGSASVICGTNVFAHVDDLDDFIKGIKELLSNNGVFIFESPNLMSLVKENAYSSVYHEHLSYLSLKPTIQFLAKHDMEVFHVEERDIHEGSFRIFIARKGSRFVGESVGQYLAREESAGIHDLDKLKEFSAKAYSHLREMADLIEKLKDQGKKIVLLSCPAKGMTEIQCLGLHRTIVEFGTEKSRLKIGKFCPGSDIEVKSDNALVGMTNTVGVLLAWNFGQEIMKNNQVFRNGEGNLFLLPFPEIKLI